ncbi:hypothetical protein NDU88_007443 [Pleurodeles waltl]|uniref:Uncharacterized protein n=1 Tax=Pleurodeles waltl TaxID=8319 RepID=A0AAV7N6Y7_PLEWA|nr:hypothetical protein NDU88_007443 [Pleurodeles waltl]
MKSLLRPGRSENDEHVKSVLPNVPPGDEKEEYRSGSTPSGAPSLWEAVKRCPLGTSRHPLLVPFVSAARREKRQHTLVMLGRLPGISHPNVMEGVAPGVLIRRDGSMPGGRP